MIKVGSSVTEKQYELLKMLVEEGEYGSISDAIRDAIRQFLSDNPRLKQILKRKPDNSGTEKR